MKMKRQSASDKLDYHINLDQSGEELVIVHNTIDDGGGLDGSSVEGGAYVVDDVKEVLAETRMKITELPPITMDLTQKDSGDPSARYLKDIVKHTDKAADQIESLFRQGKKVLSLGGNHVRALDVIGAMRASHALGMPLGILWVDAHPDLNTPESTVSGHIHGMPTSVFHGYGPSALVQLLKDTPSIDPQNFMYIGINAIDHPKNEDGSERKNTELTHLRELIRKGVQCFTIEEIKETRYKGRVPDTVKRAVTEFFDRLNARHGKLWVEWDVDVVDTTDMPAAAMDNLDGMSAAQIHDLFNHIGSRCSIDGLGISEIVPAKDRDGKSVRLIAESVGNIFGVSNPSYSKHMQKARMLKHKTRPTSRKSSSVKKTELTDN